MSESVFKSGRRRGFAVVYRDVAQDRRLSLKARGLFLLLQSLPEDWQYTISGLATVAGTGKDQIRSALSELLDVGYLVKEQRHDCGGKFAGNIFVLQEEAPLSGNPTTVYEQTVPLSGKPITEKPTTGKPSTENPTLQNKNIQSKNRNTPYSPPKGDDPDLARSFDLFWAKYPKKVKKQKARQLWAKLAPDAALSAVILDALDRQRRSDQWTRDGGRYVPDPTTWLNGRRWEDELTPPPDKRPPRREVYGWE